MKIVVKELSLDRSKMIAYLMTVDNIAVKAEMANKDTLKDVVESLVPEGEVLPLTIRKYKTRNK